MKKIFALLLLALTLTAEVYIRPDGTYGSSEEYSITPNGTYVDGDSYQITPDGTYIEDSEEEYRDVEESYDDL